MIRKVLYLSLVALLPLPLLAQQRSAKRGLGWDESRVTLNQHHMDLLKPGVSCSLDCYFYFPYQAGGLLQSDHFTYEIGNTSEPTGINGIFNANADVEYFNLYGLKVAEPADGIYIRRQGNTVTKVLIRK